MSCLYACAYVWAGVCGCVWLRLIRSSWESSPLGYISSCHALPLVRSLQFAVDAYEAFLVPGFRDSWALLLSWTPIAGDSSAHCFPALPASAPTESSVSAYGKLRFCLRKAPRLPTEAPPLCLRKAPFSFSLCITSCNKLSFSATESSRLHCDSSNLGQIGWIAYTLGLVSMDYLHNYFRIVLIIIIIIRSSRYIWRFSTAWYGTVRFTFGGFSTGYCTWYFFSSTSVGVDRYVFFRADTDYYRSSRPITDILNRYTCLV